MAVMRTDVLLLGLLLFTADAAAQVPGVAIMGRVLGPDGAPIGNARVDLLPALSRYAAGLREAQGQDPVPAAAHTATGPDGRFTVRAPRPGMWRVVVAADGFVPHQQILPLLEDAELLPAELPVDSGLRARILSREGSPIAGARVLGEPQSRFPASPRGGWTPVERRGSAGVDGSVRLSKAAAETLRLWVAAPGFPVQEGPETMARTAVVQLTPGTAVSVDVREEGAEPLPDAVVRDLAGRFFLGLTGPDGRLTLTGPAPGEIAVAVETAGGPRAPFRWQAAAGAASGPGRPRLLMLPPSSSLTGRIIDRDTGASLPGALVWPESDPGCWVRTDASGTFRLHGAVGPAETRLVATALGHAPGFLPLQGGMPGTPALLALVPTAALHGTVVDERRRPLAEVELRISLLGAPEEKEAHTAHTGADGAFHAPGLRAGASYLVTAILPGFAPAATPVAIPKAAVPVPGLRLVLGRGRTALGHVEDESGRPVAGAHIELASATAGRVVASTPDPGGDGAQQTRTGADGRFELHHLPAGWFSLRIEADGFPAFEQDGLQVPTGTARADLGRFRLQHGGTLQGWAGDEDGQPLAGAEVWIIPTAVRDWTGLYAKGPAAVSGADGSFAVRDLPEAAGFGLDVCRAGYLPLSAIIREVNREVDREGGREPFRAVLRRAAKISGRVAGEGGAPVPAARIEGWLAGEEPARNESLRPCRRGSGSATADTEGRFRLDGLPPGWWSLRAMAEGHLSSTRERLHVLAGESRDDVEIVLSPGAAVYGRVFTSAGEPAPGARVSAFSEGGTVETLAGGDGAYRLAGVELGERTVEASRGDGMWASRSLTVQREDNRLDLTMDQGSPRQEVRGRVLGEDGPIAGAAVLAAGSARTFSAADGSFLLAVEDNNEYDVWAEKEGFAAAKAGAAVHVAGAPVEGVEIRLSRGGAISGRLLGLDREELTQANVEVELVPSLLARAAVDSQGRYRVEGIPSGAWTVTARAGARVVREQAVLPPDTFEVAVDLAFAESQEVSGWVSGPAGEPVADAYLRFFAPGGVSGGTYSLSDGAFHLRLEDGTYRIAGRREGYLWTVQKEPVAVEGATVSGLEVHLERAGLIRGRILGLSPGEHAKAVWASTATPNGGRREGQLDQEGGFMISDVPPGDWTVTVAYGGRELSVPFHLDPGQEAEWVEIELDSQVPPD